MDKTLEYLVWALSIIDDYYKRTGEIGFAEPFIGRCAKLLVNHIVKAAL